MQPHSGIPDGQSVPDGDDVHSRRMLERLPIAAYTCDSEGRITFFNQHAAALWGREPKLNDGDDRFCGSVRLFAADGKALRHDDSCAALALRHNRPCQAIEVIIERPDGQRRAVLAHATPEHDAQGRLVGATNLLVDISDQKHYEQRLRISEQQLADFFENAPVSLHWVGPDGRILRVNRTELELLGYSDDEYVGHHIAEFHADREAIEDILRRLQAGENLHDYPARLRCKDGSIRHVLISSNVFWEHGKFVHTRCFTRDVTDRKQAEEALLQSEQRFARFMQHLPGLAWIKDLQGRYVYANDAAVKVFGRTAEQLYNKTDDEVFPSETATQFRRNDQRALESASGVQVIETLEHEDGKLHFSVVSKFPILDSNGEPLLVGGMAVDITDHNEAQTALRESEERLRLALEAGRMGVWDWHIQTGDIKWSDNLEPIHGLAPGTFGGTFEAFQQLVHPDDRPMVQAALAEALQNRSGFDVEFRNVWPDGSVHWMAGKGQVFTENGQPVRMVGVGIDITDRKRAEEALRASEERYRAVVESQAEMLCRFHPDGTILFVNDAYARARGTTPEQLMEANFWDFIAQEDQAAVRAMLDRLTPEAPQIRIENRFETVEGVRWTLWTNRGLKFDAAGRLIEAQSTGIDITERKRAEEALREADRRKDEFLATLAHELRNPLAPIRTGLEVMRMAMDDPDVLEQTRSTMERQTQQLIALVDDLLDVSRITRGKLELRKCRVPLGDVVESAVEASRPFIDEAGQSFSIDVAEPALCLYADPHRLAQVLSNLLNNAAKYTPATGCIGLSASRQGGELVLAVRDTGIGIPPEMLERVFEMFAQIDRPEERGYTGLGIGLTLVKSLVEMHGGRVDVHSDGANQGSTFMVRLPLLVQDLPDALQPQQAVDSIAPPLRLLLVDDNKAAAEMLATVVSMLGNEVRTAGDGVEAIDIAAEYLPDVILMDLGMPRMNGYDAAHYIRQQSWGKRIKLVALTGWGQDEDKRRTKEAGFDLHLVKPVEPDSLQRLFLDLSRAKT